MHAATRDAFLRRRRSKQRLHWQRTAPCQRESAGV